MQPKIVPLSPTSYFCFITRAPPPRTCIHSFFPGLAVSTNEKGALSDLGSLT